MSPDPAAQHRTVKRGGTVAPGADGAGTSAGTGAGSGSGFGPSTGAVAGAGSTSSPAEQIGPFPGAGDDGGRSLDRLVQRARGWLTTIGRLSVVRAVRRVVSPVWSAVTPLGRSVLAASIFSSLLAALFGWVEFAVFAIAGFVSLVIGVVMLLAANDKLKVDLGLKVRRVVAGDFAATDVDTTNTASRRMLPVNLEARVGRSLARMEIPSLSGGQTHSEQLLIGTEKRAVVPVGPVRSVHGDPLGLVRREVRWTGVEELFVHPRTTTIGPLINGLRRDMEGQATNHRSPSDVAFHALREYVVGDDRRHIHWRTTARQTDGTLMVREFVDTRRSEVAVLLSLRWEDWSDEDSFELGVSAAASVALRADRDGLEHVMMAGQKVVPAHSVTMMMDGLARIERGDDQVGLSTVARRHSDRLAATSITVLVVGSTADPVEVQRAASVIGTQTMTIVLVADTSRVTGRRVTSGIPLCDLGSLDDLAHVLSVVGA